MLRRVGGLSARSFDADIEMDGRHKVRAARAVRSGRPNSGCCAISSNIKAASSRANGCRFGMGQDSEIELRTVDVHIRRLRKAINAGGKADIIRTVRSAGYALDADGHA